MSASHTSSTSATGATRAAKAARERDGASTTDTVTLTSDAPVEEAQVEDVSAPSIQDVWRAQDVVRPHVYHTPLLHSRTLSAMTGATVYLKAENLQRAGSYKVRGATYKLSRLTDEERARGVIAASAGNHAQGVAIAARALGISCMIVMPATAPLAKITATESYGAKVILAGATYNDAYERACQIQAETGTIYIHAFDDPDIIAGQGTVGLEILADLPDVEAIVAPIGGGGLISGIAIAVKSLKPGVRIIGVEAAGAAAMRDSLAADHLIKLETLSTVADGIAVKAPGERTFAIARKLVDEVVTVQDDDIIRTVLLLMERGKLVVEGAGAAGAAALLSRAIALPGMRTAIILSGGNIDMNLVGRFIAHGLAIQGRYLALRTLLIDRPGELMRLLAVIADQSVNVLDVSHHRSAPHAPIQHVEVSLTLETRNREHCDQLIQSLRDQGFPVVEETSAFAHP